MKLMKLKRHDFSLAQATSNIFFSVYTFFFLLINILFLILYSKRGTPNSVNFRAYKTWIFPQLAGGAVAGMKRDHQLPCGGVADKA